MTDLTPPEPPTSAPAVRPPHTTPTTPTDPWSIWFSRLVQVVGLLLVIHQTVVERNDRPWLLLVATAMMLGGLGLQLVLRSILDRAAP